MLKEILIVFLARNEIASKEDGMLIRREGYKVIG